MRRCADARYRGGMSTRGGNRWWLYVPLLSAGTATFLVILYAGVRLRSTLTIALSGVYLGLWLGLFLLSGSAFGPTAAALTLCVSWLGGSAHAHDLSLRFAAAATGARRADVEPPLPRLDPAIATASGRMARRRESRRIVEDNIALAAELRIGRPDLYRSYDDGGVVDVNHAPAEVLVSHLDMAPAVADEVIRVRDLRNGFDSADDMFIACRDLNPDRFAMIRDRLVFMPRDIIRTRSV